MQGVFTFADGWLNFFLRLLYHLGYRISRLQFKIFLPADSSVSIDWPTLHAFGRAGRRPFCRDFFVENGKIFVGKSGQAGKNFRGSKIFDGVNFGANQKRAVPWSSMQWPFWRFVRGEALSKLLKGCPATGQPFGAEWRCPRPSSAIGRSRFFKSDLLCCLIPFCILLKWSFYLVKFSFLYYWIAK